MASDQTKMVDERAVIPVAPRTRNGGGRYDTAQLVLLLLPFGWACLFLISRPLGAPGLALALAPLVLVAFNAGRRYLVQPLLLFAVITAIYALLSYFGLLDQRLTLLFSPDAVFQQCAYGLFLAFAVAGFAFYHEGVAEGRPGFLRLEEIVFFLAVFSRLLSMAMANPTAEIGLDLTASSSGLSQFVNGETFLGFIFVRRLLQTPRYSQPINVFVALCLLITAGSAQSRLALLPLLAMAITPSLRKPIAAWFIVSLFSLIIVAWPFAQEVWIADANTGIRLFFWHDAVQRFFESYGIGVGFGTETIRPVYDLKAADVTLQTIDSPGFILIGSHNAFIDALYRMGVLGFACLAYYVTKTIWSVLRSVSADVFDCWVVCLVITVLVVNVGLVSFNFFFGSAFLLGWLTYRASRSQVIRSI
jgi:hypothetical protein